MSSFARYRDATWSSTDKTPRWNAIAITAARTAAGGTWLVVALGEGGQIWEYEPDTEREAISQLPRSFGMTNLACIGNQIYAFGMGRVVLQRHAEQDWADISAPWPDLDDGVIGFTDMAEHPSLGMVAVGWQGEVWTKRATDAWLRVDTPSNANFNAVDVDADGTIYCVGDKGAILRGQHGVWTAVNSGTAATLQDVCCFDDQLYVATDFDVLVLTPQGLVRDDGFDLDDAPSTCLKVVNVQGLGICSLGPLDVFIKRGAAWTRIA